MSEHGGGFDREDGGSRPVPDPTVLTTEQLLREISSLRSYIDGKFEVIQERLNGVDKATVLREENFKNFRSRVDEKVQHLTDLRAEQFKTVEVRFKERAEHAERETRIKKEAAAQQEAATTKAIDKSERNTADTIKTNQELSKTTTDALTKGLDELKLKVSAIESMKLGASEQKTETQASVGTIAAIIGSALALIAALAVYVSRPEVPPVIVETPTTQTTP
jgi:cobalamin biosynthesis Mg chelatase CobN